MTPAAITPAGRSRSAKPAQPAGSSPRPVRAAGSAPAAGRTATTARTKAPRTSTPAKPSGRTDTATPGRRRRVTQPAAPRSPRRVSGPATGRVAGATVTQPRRAPKRARITAPRRRAHQPALPLGERFNRFIRGLPDHVVLDRLVRGRAWIPVLGVMLVGIVAMQVEVLKLGASMGRSIEVGSALQSRNELLRESVAQLGDDQRIERLAFKQGMVMPGPAGVGFLSADAAGAVKRAIAGIHVPDAAGFLALTSGNGAVATSPTPAASTGTTGSLATVSPATVSPATVSPATVSPATPTPAATGTTAAGTTAAAASTGTATTAGTAATGLAASPSTGASSGN